MSDGDIDSLQVKQIGDVFDSSVGDNRQDAKILAVIERFCELGCKTDKAPLEEAGRDSNSPIVDASRLLALAVGRGGCHVVRVKPRRCWSLGWPHYRRKDSRHRNEQSKQGES